jgi:hypothetical protein
VVVARSPLGIRRFIAMRASGDLPSSCAVGVGSKGVDVSDVPDDGDTGPVPCEHPSAVWVGFAEPSRLSAERSMDGKVEFAHP